MIERTLGAGRHPSAATADVLAVAFTERIEVNRVGVQLLDAWGNREGDIDAGGSPSSAPNPVLAALPDGSFALAFNDLQVDGAALGVALGRLDPVSAQVELGPHANESTLGAQYDPDIISLSNGDVLVAWTDAGDAQTGPDIVGRRFDSDLQPLEGEMLFGGSDLPEGSVALTALGQGWAAAWREAQPDGSEAVIVFDGSARSSIAAAQPGPARDRPALIALDESHVFVAYTVGTDPLGTGVAATPRLFGAVVDTGDSSVQLLGAIEPLAPNYSGSAPEQLALAQHQPAAVVAGGQSFVAWRSDSPLGDTRGGELWLKRLVWDGEIEELSLEAVEIPLPRQQEHGVGDQRDPALVATPLPPQGSLLLAWTDYGLVLDANQSQPDIAAQLAPVPLLRGLPEPHGPAVLIDDFEDGDGFIVEHEGRGGAWLTYNDGSSGGAQSPAPGFSLVPAMPGRDSASAARMTGSGFTSWGAGIGVDLNHDGSSKLPYDATAYAGITFWARAATATNIRFNIADANTDPDGGVCSNCFDHFGVNLTVGPGWQRYTFAWSQLGQEGWGEARPGLDVAQLFALHFQVRPNQSFDLWLDDVAFLPAWSFELIDDLEDGDGQILAQGGRVGAWFTYNDGSGSQSPATGAPNFSPGAPGRESSYAARTNGSGFTVWGAGLAVELNADGALKQPYDASAYAGVTFWARAASTLPVRLMAPDVNTDADGGVCSVCYDHFGRDITLTSDWQRFTITWAELGQQQWGDPQVAVEPGQLYGFLFQTPPNQSFDIEVDELAFLIGGPE